MTFLFVMASVMIYAQYQNEAILYSQKLYQSNARSAGVGNAYGAVGASFISSSINPAGLAFYRSSEFSFSNAFYYSLDKTSYLGNSNNERKFNYNFPDLGLVFSHINKKSGQEVTEGWVNYAFAAGINRTNNYHHRSYYSGINNSSSIIDYHLEIANGKTPASLPALTGFYYDVFLIDTVNSLTKYESAMDTVGVEQSRYLTTRGSAYDINFSFGANYSNIVFLGATIGFPVLNYHKNSKFTETSIVSNPTNYLGHTWNRTLDIKGTGIQATFGLLIKPFDYFRFGGSIQTPTVYSMSEVFEDDVQANLINYDNDLEPLWSDPNYRFITPFKATASAALIAGKYGFLSIDYEYIDYSTAYFDTDDPIILSDLMIANDYIDQVYGSASNIRIGAELKYAIFAIRGGYNIYGSPYNSKFKPDNVDGSSKIYSLGFGIREKAYFFDIAYQKSLKKEFELPYTLSNKNVEGAKSEISYNKVILTFGLRF